MAEAASGLRGLQDRPRSGRPRTIDRRTVIATTLTRSAKRLGITHWSTRALARYLKISDAEVAAIWREAGVQPWRVETFTFSTDPELEAKVIDIIGLYMNPPQNTVVLCIDEKSQIQALDRTQPMLAMQPGLPERRTHDYKRHGTTTLFAALEIATGQVTGGCNAGTATRSFLAFLKHLAKAYPDVELHLVMDNYATHKKAEVRAWLAANPRIHVHVTPTSGSWLNLVECWFAIIERQPIHRGSFGSVPDLNAAIRRFINGWNERSTPFTWIKPAEEILPKLKRKRTSHAAH